MDKKIMQVTVTAILAALICVATMIVQIPISATGGYANLGDGIILISSFLLPVGCSITAAALGSALADLLLGYVAFIPGTLMIKAFMAFLSWLVLHSFHQIETDRKAICAMIFSGIASELDIKVFGRHNDFAMLLIVAIQHIQIPAIRFVRNDRRKL